MIYDSIENVKKYRSVSKWFAYAADFLASTDLEKLPLGRTEICGDHVFANVMEADTQDAAGGFFEVHKKYWDIQLDIEGVELIQIGTDKDWSIVEFNEATDFGKSSCKEGADFVMGPGRFIVCMDEEPHKPTCTLEKPQKVKKCVIKVEVER